MIVQLLRSATINKQTWHCRKNGGLYSRHFYLVSYLGELLGRPANALL